MIFPVQAPWQLSSGFDEMRPLSAPAAERWHPHGAWDVATPSVDIVCPEPAHVWYLIAVRDNPSRTMSELDPPIRKFDIQAHNYFYDIYGAVIFAAGASGIVHVLCHSWIEQIWKYGEAWEYKESAAAERFPLLSWSSYPKLTQPGEVIGRVGNAGYSTGSHVHYELHLGNRWQHWDERIRPDTIYQDFKELDK